MNIVSEIWTWQEGERLYSRLTTNVCVERFLAKLAARNLLESAETIHAYFGDRADGGSGYEILWKQQVSWEQLGNTLTRI